VICVSFLFANEPLECFDHATNDHQHTPIGGSIWPSSKGCRIEKIDDLGDSHFMYTKIEKNMIEETDRIHTRTSHRFERRRKEKEGYIKKIKSYNNHTKQIDGERKREKRSRILQCHLYREVNPRLFSVCSIVL